MSGFTAVYVNTPGPESTQMCCTGLIWTVCVLLGLRNPHGIINDKTPKDLIETFGVLSQY